MSSVIHKENSFFFLLTEALILSVRLGASTDGEHHMVTQQASHDMKEQYLMGTLEPNS